MNDDLFELGEEMSLRNDPREALYNDYLDGVRSAKNTLVFIDQLKLFPAAAARGWWGDFVRTLTVEAHKEDTKMKEAR